MQPLRDSTFLVKETASFIIEFQYPQSGQERKETAVAFGKERLPFEPEEGQMEMHQV